MHKRTAIVLALMLAAAAAEGCTPAPPYVYKKAEFDRGQRMFGREPTDIKSVTVCYGSWKTTPDEVTAVAEAECGKFGKVAVFTRQDYQICPLVTPVAAYYYCDTPASTFGGPVARPGRPPVPAELPSAPGWIAPPFGMILEPKESEE